ncbi:hypothetical protein F53441_1122 [Fusarium austroafricanum]|uniref:Uncharacterized protein n=1 Tax=Fusarium austroafricanum TaxID=2364996 RepID=A0A8H4P2L0_9HYPO|nr:hypothetical protein F53441_1122 [Fusarium austroafricanum]
MASQSASSPTGVPLQNGVNGANHMHGQTSVPLPSYAPSSRPASVPSAPPTQRTNTSPKQTNHSVPPGQHRSPPMQASTLKQTSPQQGTHPSPQMQNATAPQSKTPQMPSQQAPTQAQGLVNLPLNQMPKSYQDLINLVERTPASVVRQVVRDRWEKSLAGSQYHIAFLLNATMHQASPETVSKAVQEFGASLVHKSKRELISHLGPTDYDELADLILPRASTQFLDRALARRLETIPARQLVNALARAERLGYDPQDIIQEHDERVIPSLHSLPMQPQPHPQPTILPANPAPHVQHYQPQPVASHSPPPPVSYANHQPVQSQPPQTSLPPGPSGLVWCRCGWPCASRTALDYHHKKSACNRVQENDIAGRDICLFCGCRFGSGGGLLYHEKSSVCGDHPRQIADEMRELLHAYRPEKPRATVSNPPQIPQMPVPSSQPQWVPSTPSQPTSTPNRDSGRDPYSHLNPDTLKRFNDEMKNAEEKYGGLMREAMLLNEPERGKRLASLKNSYNTKQSTTRKKYGIRLRERRTKGEIEAEEARLFGTPSGTATPSQSTPVPDGGSRPKRPRTGGDEQLPPFGGTNESQESPRKRVPVSEMGGLSGSQATAELTDPTTYLNPAQPRYAPPKVGMSMSQPKAFGSPGSTRTSIGGTQDDPMAIDDDEDSDTDSDSDGDIPASIS